MVYKTLTGVWEEPDLAEKEHLMGYQTSDMDALGVTEEHRGVRLGRAMDGYTMRSLGALIFATHA